MFFRKISSSVAATAFLTATLGVPSVASANVLTLEYYTYGGFQDVVSAFTRCSLIFSSNGYKTLFPTVWISSLAFSLVAAALYKLQTAVREEGMAVTRPEGMYSAIVHSFVAAALFIGFVLPTGTLQVYDPGVNKAESVGGIPLISVLTAGAFNMIERTVVDLAETSGDPVGYSKQSGVKGMMVLNKLVSGVDPKDTSLNATLLKFIPDCVYPELTRTGTTLLISDINWNTTSLETALSLSVNPSLYTTVYGGSTSPQGDSMSCTDAWTNIQSRLPTMDFKASLVDACNSAGYPATEATGAVDAVGYAACTSAVDGLIAGIGNTYVTNLTSFLEQVYLSSMFRRVLAADNSELYTSFESFTQNTAYSDTFIKNLPVIRGALILTLVAMTPFVSLLILTKYWVKGVSFIIGGFAFITVWGGGAAIAQSIFVDKSFQYWAGVLSNGVGIMPMAMLSSAVVSQLTVYKYVMGAMMSMSGVFSAVTFGVLGSLNTAAHAGTSGSAERGRLGFEAEQRRKMATLEEKATTMGTMASGYSLHEAMANVGGIANYQNAHSANLSGQEVGLQKLHQDLGNKGMEDHISSGVQSSVYSGNAQQRTYERIADTTGTTVSQAAVGKANANVAFTTSDAHGHVTRHTADFGQGQTAGGRPQANITLDSGKAVEPTSGAIYSTQTVTSTSTPSASATNVKVDGHGTATINRGRAQWSEGDLSAIASELGSLSPNATPEQYSNFEQRHGMKPGTAQSMHQNLIASRSLSEKTVMSQVPKLSIAAGEASAIAAAVRALPQNASPEQYKAIEQQYAMQPGAAQDVQQRLHTEDGKNFESLKASLSNVGPGEKVEVTGVKLENSPSSAVVGTRRSRTEVAATEIASQMNKEQLFSNTDGYLKSLGWDDRQVKSFKEAWRKQTGYDISEQTAHSQANTEQQSSGNSVKVSGGLSGSIGFGRGGIEIGHNSSKAKISSNAVDKSITGGASESSSHATDRELAKVLSSMVSESKDSRFAETLSSKFSISEASKAAISNSRESSAGSSTSMNLDTFMLNDLIHNDAHFKGGTVEQNTAAAIKFLDGSSPEAEAYKAGAKEKFLSEYELVSKTDASIGKSMDGSGLPDKHDRGPDQEDIRNLEGLTSNLQDNVKSKTAGGPGTGTNTEHPTSHGRSARRSAKSVPQALVHLDPIGEKVRQLNAVNNEIVKGQTMLPRIGNNAPDPRNTARTINVTGGDVFSGNRVQKMPELGRKGKR